MIKGIRDAEGSWLVEENKDKVILEFFRELFTTPNQGGNMDFLEGFAERITTDMNEKFIHEFTEEEVTLALQQMGSTKAPGPDGMMPIFFQKYWDAVGKDVASIVLIALNSGKFPNDINHTFITFIPKKEKPKLVANYISLCNVIYKLITKVLANKLKVMLPNVVSYSLSQEDSSLTIFLLPMS